MGSVFSSLLGPQLEQSRERRIYGLVTAIVTGIMPDGTYEVSYLTMGNGEPSAPARVMMPSAGAKRGVYFFPDVGDEVVIAFQSGDVNMPMILGAAFNENSEPPDQAQPSPDNNVRTIVSRSGHEITLDDTPGSGKVTVKTNGGHTLVLDDTPPGKVTLSSAGGSSIVMDDAIGTLKISATVKIEISAPVVNLSANATMAVTAPAGINLNTTGAAPASLVTIDGKPFGAHVHVPFSVPATGSTGPVGP
jgi:phage baseplate assembly protein gpV